MKLTNQLCPLGWNYGNSSQNRTSLLRPAQAGSGSEEEIAIPEFRLGSCSIGAPDLSLLLLRLAQLSFSSKPHPTLSISTEPKMAPALQDPINSD